MEWARTKIVATIGPATSAPTVLRRLLHAGLDVARLNFSHGTHVEHAKYAQGLRAAARAVGRPVAILQDLQGAKIRVGEVKEEGKMLKVGEKISIVSHGAEKGELCIDYPRLSKDLKVGHRIMIDDGLIVLEVTSVRLGRIHAVTRTGGLITSRKGVNFPDSKLVLTEFTEQDKEDVAWGIKTGVEWICLSFVSGPEVIQEARAYIAKLAKAQGVVPPRLMAKVERRVAIERLDDICSSADAVLLGRGDLGVEVPPEEVPLIQQQVIATARHHGIPVIVATHMLESMRRSPRATRAEYSDVATAVFEGTDAVMLSAETATGKYPAVALQAMASIVREAELSHYVEEPHPAEITDTADAVTLSLSALSRQGMLRGVLVDGTNESALCALSRARLPVPVFVAHPAGKWAVGELLRYGAYPLVLDHGAATWQTRAIAQIKATKILKKDGLFAVIESLPHRLRLELLPRI